MKFFKIENNPEKAVYFQSLGIDRIFLDLEIIGKKERQGHLNTVISSHHSIEDVKKLSEVLTTSELLVRINPIHDSSAEEIERVLKDGADILMLPMFKTAEEVAFFISRVKGRATTCLLLETSQALCRIDDILKVPGIDEIHIGLNDLHLSMNLDFMFELLSGGLVEYLGNKIKSQKILFGFGGIAPLDEGIVSGEMILKEHFRIGSSMVILSRQFDKLLEKNQSKFEDALSKLFKMVKRLENSVSNEQLLENKLLVLQKIRNIINS